MTNNNFWKTLILIILSLLLLACSTKKNKWPNRAYHNTTARFNVFFNGNESFKEGVATIEKNHKDNYNKILPIYKIGTKEQAQVANTFMDKAITKATKGIKKHSMLIGGKEYCKWTDDNYLMIGKANFYKQELVTAISTFRFLMTDNAFTDKNIKQEAQIWLVRSYTLNKDLTAAEKELEILAKQSINQQEIRKNFYLAQANLYIQQDSLKKAIDPLIRAIALTKNKRERTRYMFILGQIDLAHEHYQQAAEWFTKVVKSNAEYEMVFNAKLNLAKSFDAKTGNSQNIVALLNKMLKDDKNTDYLDQIYYALGIIAFKEGDEEKAIKYFKLSAQKSKNNNQQKTESFLKLAEIYFNKKQYTLSQAYYDSTAAVLPKDFPNREKILNIKNNLTKLVSNYQTIKEKDSLLLLSKLSDKEIETLVEKHIEKLKEQARLQKEKQTEDANLQANSVKQLNFSQDITNDWYFYNPSMITAGSIEFKKLWGNRPLEDNWRRKNKQNINPQNLSADNTVDVEDEKNNPLYDKNTYIKKIPRTPEAIKNANDSIAAAFYTIGNIYHDKLFDNPKAIEAYEELLKRYPENSYIPIIYYQLYRICLKEQLPTKANYYKNILLEKHPESDYAKIIQDPNYFKEIEKQQNKAIVAYENTYKLFQQEHHALVLSQIQQADSLYKTSTIYPKFLLLKALTQAKQKDTTTYQATLKHIIKTFPNTEEQKKAEQLLSVFKPKNLDTKEPTPQQTKTDNTNPIKDIYNLEHVATPFEIIIFNAKQIDKNKLQIALSDFNTNFYQFDNLSINTSMFDADQIISIRSFKDKEKAMLYHKTMLNNQDIQKVINNQPILCMPISINNYTTLFTTKDIKTYKTFFDTNYEK